MGEPERVPGNSEPALSQDELIGLRSLLSGKPYNQTQAPDPHRSFHEVGVELRSMNSRLDLMQSSLNSRLDLMQSSINSRLDLMQKVFAGSALIVMACLGYLFLKTTDISGSVGKIETRLVGIDERFDGSTASTNASRASINASTAWINVSTESINASTAWINASMVSTSGSTSSPLS